MGRHFFSGGLMPSLDLLPAVPSPLTLDGPGAGAASTTPAPPTPGSANLDAAADDVARILERVAGPVRAHSRPRRWRLFFLACAELFATADGTEWGVAHYRFRRPRAGLH